MKFKEIKKISEGRYISLYNVTYETELKNEKVYEMISRNSNIHSFDELHGNESNAVVIVAYNNTGDKILLQREFRMAPGKWVYNFPAGMIEQNETPEQTAVRELKEETGLSLYEITDTLSESYSAVGFSNELNITVIGKAQGEFEKSTSDTEEISAEWYTKDEVRKLLKSECFAARTQAWCYMWSR